MFCFQCEQTAGCSACTGAYGVCGKSAVIADLQDRLIGELIGLARAIEGNEELVSDQTNQIILDSLFSTITNVNFNESTLNELRRRIAEEKQRLVPRCYGCASQCGRNNEYDMRRLWNADENIRSLKSLLLFGIKGIAAYAYHASALGYTDKEVSDFFCKALLAIGSDLSVAELLPLTMEAGRINYKCMALLDRANTETFGNPVPTEVTREVEKGAFIVISGHDLYVLKQLLEQTKDTCVNVYTHGEMLPAHAYPEFKKYPNLKGHFGTAWQNQQKEFEGIPAPILFTTNCLMPPTSSYADRVFTTELVSYPEIIHIGKDMSFAPIIKRAVELGGYPEKKSLGDTNNGSGLMTGFGRNAVLSAADTIVDMVKNGTIKHFFLVGGCDGAKPGRSYYTEFVKQTPANSIVLTLGCGKYRLNDIDAGNIGGLPRIMDMGQCNDAYGAIEVAAALAKAFGCGINDLPLSIVLSWYEQKAVCILLTLLYLGVKNILLGPSLPAFISPDILKYLQDSFNIASIGTPKADIEKCLGQSE